MTKRWIEESEQEMSQAMREAVQTWMAEKELENKNRSHSTVEPAVEDWRLAVAEAKREREMTAALAATTHLQNRMVEVSRTLDQLAARLEKTADQLAAILDPAARLRLAEMSAAARVDSDQILGDLPSRLQP